MRLADRDALGMCVPLYEENPSFSRQFMDRYQQSALAIAPVAYLLTCLTLAALIAYPLQIMLQGGIDLHDLVSRGTEVLLVLGLIPLGRLLRLDKADLGAAVGPGRFLVLMARGFCFGTLMLSLHMALLIATDVRMILPERLELGRIFDALQKALLVGLAVGLVEETVFRGFLFGSLRKKSGPIFAAAISSLFFAGLHFLKSDWHPAMEATHWYTGFSLVTDAFRNLARIDPSTFLALLTAGIFLSCVRLHLPASSLPLCIGIHAGWVFVIKSSKPFTKRTLDPFWSGFAGSFDGVIGYLSASWLSVLIILLAMSLRRKHSA